LLQAPAAMLNVEDDLELTVIELREAALRSLKRGQPSTEPARLCRP
jgi:hypothetical protein